MALQNAFGDLALDSTLTDETQITKIKEVIPTSTLNNNASIELNYDVNGNITSLVKTIGTAHYTKTLTYDVNNILTDISVWVAS